MITFGTKGREKTMLKHYKPIAQSPSPTLIKNINLHRFPSHLPIADIACGYGRNGAFFVDAGFFTIFCDRDDAALTFISLGKNVSINGDIDPNLYTTKHVDLLHNWPFARKSLAGIICVHFYHLPLIPYIISSLIDDGFFYFETIDNRGMNYLELPRSSDNLRELLYTYFDVEISSFTTHQNGRQTIKFLGYKKTL